MIIAFLRLVRFPNLLLLALSLLGARWLLASACTTNTFSILAWLGAVVFAAAGGYVANDIADLAIDRINKPNRPLPAEKISPFQAQILSVTFFLLAIIASTINFYLLLLTLASVGLLIFYALWLKCTPLLGNFVVAVLSATAFASLLLVCGHTNNKASLYELILFSGLTHFLREQVKCLEDIAGDDVAKCRTLPVVIGTSKAQIVAVGTALGLAVACLGVGVGKSGGVAIAWLLLSLLFCIFARRLHTSVTAVNFAYLSTVLKLYMIVGMIVVLWGSKVF
ncbi:UbiA family prenyltransferase [Rhodoflexus sp.]